MGKKRKTPGINSSSMADISFILLIFFLVTTSMDSSKGLARRLPQPVPEDQVVDDTNIKKRNIFTVKVNSMNQLMVQGDIMDIGELRHKTKEFIKNEARDEKLPEFTTEHIPPFGDVEITNHVISLQNDVDTQYQMYISVQNELIAAYNELREEYARMRFGQAYDDLPNNLQKAIQKVYPQKISEAEPKDHGAHNKGGQI